MLIIKVSMFKLYDLHLHSYWHGIFCKMIRHLYSSISLQNNDSLLAELANDVNPSLQAEQNATMLQEPNVTAESYRPGLFARLALLL